MPGLSRAVDHKVLEHIVAKTAYTMPTSPLYLALTTVAVAETDTAGTLTEATYTGYARKSVAGTDWATASANQIANANAITFAACTAGSSAIVGYALVTTASGAGEITAFGVWTGQPITVSTTQTPFNVAVGVLIVTVD